MSTLPDYWLSRPDMVDDERTRLAFDELLRSSVRAGECAAIDYTLAQPKWQFLCHVADHHDIVLHGSGKPDIEQFEPRQPQDVTEFGNQRAVYAASDGVWAMFFAIVDRERVDSVANACVRVRDASGGTHGPFYVFSVSRSALAARPWRAGSVYLLPRQTFVPQPPEPFGDAEVDIAQCASPQPVSPIARLEVGPDDFPFLAQIRGHDDDRLQQYATAMQSGAPWPDDE